MRIYASRRNQLDASTRSPPKYAVVGNANCCDGGLPITLQRPKFGQELQASFRHLDLPSLNLKYACFLILHNRNTMDKTPAPIFRKQRPLIPSSSVAPSSSPAFGTPVYPPKPFNINAPKAAILPIILPPATLRPLAFRTFTKKHSLTLTSSALQELASFIGRHCGSGWREEGLAERVLEEVARSWKNRNGGVMVEGASKELQDILKTLEGNMSGGKIMGPGRELPRGDSMLDITDNDTLNTRLGIRPTSLPRQDSNASFGMSGLGMQEEADDDEEASDARAWLKVIDAYEQPRLLYNVDKKHFER